MVVPALHADIKSSTKGIATQWLRMYNIGKAQNPPIAAAAAASYLYISYALRLRPQAAIYAAAAVSTLGIVPWTLAAMAKVNGQLAASAKNEVIATAQDDRTQIVDLIQKWGVLNFVRSVFPLIGAGLGLWAALPIS
jgi:hypothetical protein